MDLRSQARMIGGPKLADGAPTTVWNARNTQISVCFHEEYLDEMESGFDRMDWAKLTAHDAVIFQDPDFEVFIDPDGDLFLVDRVKELVIVSGFNVFPNELENVISLCPGVVECAAIGIADLIAGIVDNVGVVAKATVHRVGARAAVQRIVAGCADDGCGQAVT